MDFRKEFNFKTVWEILTIAKELFQKYEKTRPNEKESISESASSYKRNH